MNAKLVERLDRIYCCRECMAVFLFSSDISDHKEISGHDSIQELPFE